MTREWFRTLGLAPAGLATAAALAGCESRATPAQIRREARRQAMLGTGATGPATTGQAGPVSGGAPAQPAARRRGRPGPPLRRGAAR
jgi:hypothetical protein